MKTLLSLFPYEKVHQNSVVKWRALKKNFHKWYLDLYNFVSLKRNHTLKRSCGPVCVMHTCMHVTCLHITDSVPGKATWLQGEDPVCHPNSGLKPKIEMVVAIEMTVNGSYFPEKLTSTIIRMNTTSNSILLCSLHWKVILVK